MAQGLTTRVEVIVFLKKSFYKSLISKLSVVRARKKQITPEGNLYLLVKTIEILKGNQSEIMMFKENWKKILKEINSCRSKLLESLGKTNKCLGIRKNN